MKDEVSIVDEILMAIIFANTTKTKAMAALNGGWEGWLQVEVALGAETSGAYLAIVREDKYDGGSVRWDMKLTTQAGNKFGVELKVESASQSATIVNAWWKDITKLGNLMRGLKQSYAYLVTVSDQAARNAEDIVSTSGGDTICVRSQDGVRLYKHILRLY